MCVCHIEEIQSPPFGHGNKILLQVIFENIPHSLLSLNNSDVAGFREEYFRELIGPDRTRTYKLSIRKCLQTRREK